MRPMFRGLIRAAARLTRAGRLNSAAKVMKRLLQAVSIAVPAPAPKPRRRASPASPKTSPVAAPKPPPAARRAPIARARTHPTPAAVPADGAGESFVAGSYTHASHILDYKLYSPPTREGALPLVVMLHGCKQDPDDFALGTAMNERGGDMGFYVLYPAQSQAANPLRCWNWFKRSHQLRGSGEPALIAGMTQAVMAQHAIDPRRVYVAGLSAGGAMAVIVAAAYPDVFAAVGVHSGIARGAADSVFKAMAVMKNGKDAVRPHGARRAPATSGVPPMPVPTIVFHGDQDTTVHPSNSDQVIAVVLEEAADAGETDAASAAGPEVAQGVSTLGQKYTRSTWRDRAGRSLAEYWLVHGAGHAWSGGDPAGSFTEAGGPDATGEMLRFLFSHTLPTRH